MEAVPEHCTEETARKLASRLDEYWHSRGFPQVAHWVEAQPLSRGAGQHQNSIYCVRSNLIRGLPPAMPAGAKRKGF